MRDLSLMMGMGDPNLMSLIDNNNLEIRRQLSEKIINKNNKL